ncbi:hypothetical protein CHARACLAT_032810 [Characodon lateralis]|uniref:Ig-like domain-containing protein n=1 Tax=Characodon lateralis TaxID=208331 RepID=A0ABU7E5M2_9TELE|nr:hypothetical protein [Characodon lateralis]
MRNRSLSVLGLVLLNTLLCCGQTPDAVLTIEPNWSTFYIGESVTFICDMNEGEETDWSYQINRNGQGFIPYISYKSYRLDRLYQSGEYHCCGRRRSSDESKCSKTLSVTVSGKPQIF